MVRDDEPFGVDHPSAGERGWRDRLDSTGSDSNVARRGKVTEVVVRNYGRRLVQTNGRSRRSVHFLDCWQNLT